MSAPRRLSLAPARWVVGALRSAVGSLLATTEPTSPGSPPASDASDSRRAPAAVTRPRGHIFEGTVWPGDNQAPILAGAVLVDSSGSVAGLGPRTAFDAPDLPRLGEPDHWVGPAVIDTHVRYGAGSEADVSLAGGVVAARDLTDPALRDLILSGAGVEEVSNLVARGARAGAPWVSLRMLCGDKPPPRRLAAAAEAAHDAGLPFVVDTRSLRLALRALDAGADALASVPLDPMDDEAVESVAKRGVAVTALLQGAYPSGGGWVAARNAARLVAAGVTLLYGSGAEPGSALRVDPRELERLAAAGLGRWGAMRAATDLAAEARGLESRRLTGRIVVGQRADLVLLAGDPVVEPVAWRSVVAVCSGGRVSSDSSWSRSARAAPVPSPAPQAVHAPV